MDVQNIIIIDWLSFTSKIHSVENFIDMLGLSDIPWENGKGAHGYRDRLYFDSISIHYNGRDDMGIWCEMSGQGCRAFESLGSGDYEGLFDLIRYGDINITRLDVAFDDHSGLLDLERICSDCLAGEFISKSEYWETDISSKGRTVYHGSPQSDVLIRIYDKAAERHCTDSTHWIRVELQLRNDRARQFINLPYNLPNNFCGVLVNYLRYVDPVDSDSNRWRWPLKDYWGNMLCEAAAIKLYVKPGLEYNLDRCENYVYRQAGNAIDALLKIYGSEKFIEKLNKRYTRPNPKYQFLIDQYKDFKF